MTMSTVSGGTRLMDYAIEIDVINMSAQTTTRSGAYKIKVPVSSLSRTMQFIHRSGGKVVEVTKLSSIATLAGLPPIATPVYTSAAKATAPAATATQSEQKSAQDRSKRGGKNTKK